MALFAIADPHLAHGVDKPMAIFGPHWHDHAARLRHHWLEVVQPGDTVLIPGDISWALQLEESLPDLRFLHELPGTKILSRGNHDYWWTSLSKLEAFCQQHELGSLQFLRNNAILVDDRFIVCGTRGWILPDDPDYTRADEKVYLREIGRLRLSLESARTLDRPDCELIACLHFPPFGRDRRPTLLTNLLREHHVSHCVYGHIHGDMPAYSEPATLVDGVPHTLIAADRLSFKPLRL
jgi:predicted phosphohydrolase